MAVRSRRVRRFGPGKRKGSDWLAMTEAALPILVLALVLGGALALYPHPIDWEREDQNR